MFKIEFYTFAGGCNKGIEYNNLTKDDVKRILCEDLSEDPYVNFWYGQVSLSQMKNVQRIFRTIF